ncbi:MAG: hypothetical protein RLZZ301_1060 [Bacteroidota bacterium]|jgi:hypothetical protein
MKNIFFLLVTVFVFTLKSSIAVAQAPATTTTTTDTTKYLIIKNDGTEYVGLILSDDGREVLVQTISLGKIFIPKFEIKSIAPIDYKNDFSNGEYKESGVFTTRYQFTTNCFPIKKGENYAMLNLYGPEVHFAVHKDFSVGVMSTWIGSPLVLALKYTRGTANPKLNYGFGTLFGTTGYLNQGKGFGGLHWGMITYGDRRNNVTLSVGYSYLNDGSGTYTTPIYQPGVYTGIPPTVIGSYTQPSNKYRAPIVGLAGQVKVGKKASLIYDCMYLKIQNNIEIGSQDYSSFYDPNTSIYQSTVGEWSVSKPASQYALVIMPGMRFQRSDTRAFQISLAGVITPNASFPVPMASWFFKF